MTLTIQPVSLATAQTFVRHYHRHAPKPPVGHIFSLGLFAADLTLHGVAIVGRPLNRTLQARGYIEITRCATDGTRNACSQLYGAACREARRRGYLTVVTYTLTSETGASLRAAGFCQVGYVKGGQWARKGRPRAERPVVDRLRWVRAA